MCHNIRLTLHYCQELIIERFIRNPVIFSWTLISKEVVTGNVPLFSGADKSVLADSVNCEVKKFNCYIKLWHKSDYNPAGQSSWYSNQKEKRKHGDTVGNGTEKEFSSATQQPADKASRSPGLACLLSPFRWVSHTDQ